MKDLLDNLNKMEDYIVNKSNISLIDLQEILPFLNNIREQAINYTHSSTQLKNEDAYISGNVTALGFTTPSDHGILKIELPYSYYKIKKLRKGDKLKILIV